MLKFISYLNLSLIKGVVFEGKIFWLSYLLGKYNGEGFIEGYMYICSIVEGG